jgi:hypothetical protein
LKETPISINEIALEDLIELDSSGNVWLVLDQEEFEQAAESEPEPE